MTRVDPTHALLEEFWRTDVHRCISCGNCLYVCPVFRQVKDEAFSARGRNESLRDGAQEIASGAPADPDSLSRCLLCGRCSAICPQGVQHDKVVLSGRADVFARGGPSSAQSLVKWFLTHRHTFTQVLRLVSCLQFLLPGSIVGDPSSETPIVRHLPTLFSTRKPPRRIPSIAKRFLSDRVPEISASKLSEKKNVRIAYFAGCATEYIYPNAGVRLIDSLTALGADVCYPKDLLCCGIPILAGGDGDTGRHIARKNLAVLQRMNADYVVTGCATCGSTLRDVWPTLFDGEEKEQAFDLSAKVKDAAEMIRVLSGYRIPRFKSRLAANSKVTYHYPCHSLRYPDAADYPADMLKQVFGANYVELGNRSCCGCGGSFNLHHYELSKQIGMNKIDSIRRTRADYVVTNCPGCMIHITDGLHRSGLHQKVIHLMEAIEPV